MAEESARKIERSYEAVARTIEQKILQQHISPGDILPSETQLAAELGVNRSTLREALRSLEQNGLVMREVGRKKLRVSAPRAVDIMRRVTSTLILQRVTLEELYHAIYALEPACAEAAALAHHQSDIVALEENLARTRKALDDSASLTALDIEFHRLVAAAARNRALELAREPLSDLFYPAFYAVMSRLNAANRLLTAHQQIVDAIKLGDAKSARAWMERHIADFRRGYALAELDMNEAVSHFAAPGPLQPVNVAEALTEEL